MRDVTPALKSALAALDTAMYASFVRLPNCKIFGGRPTKYLAFVQCDNEGLRRKFFDVGQCGTVAFERLDFHRGTIRTGWRYIVRPPFLGADYSDNVILQLKRPKDDTRDIIDCLAPSPDMPQIQVWAFPDIPHPRRLVGCAKLLTTLEGSEADEMRRYICALDLSESKAKLNLFPPQHRVREMPTTFAKFLTLTARLLSWTGWPIFNPSDVDKFLQQLSGSQLNAYDHLVDSRHPVVLYQGPPGTGKTTFVSTILAIASSLNIPWIACAPSNAATDHLATVMEKKCPGFGIIRFHPLHSETRALRKKGSELSAESNPDQAAGEERAQNDRVGVNAGSPIGEASQAFYAYLLNLQQTPELEGSRTQRPNFKNMSLSVRALQNVGLLNHDIPCFRAPKNDEPQNEFRDALVKQGFAEGKSEAEKSAYKQAEDRLMLDTIRKTTGLVTTLSNTADTTLRRAKRPRLVVIDECCQSTELETLLAWAHNTETVLILVLVGDPQQLPPTVVTKDSNRGNLLVNPFAPQMCVSLFERLWRRGFPVHMLNEQYRLAEGLEEVFNQLFYDGRITNHPSTRIDNRPAAQRAIQYIRRQWHKHDGIPHILLNVPTGACLRGETFSRFNPHNIAVTANTIRGMLLEGLWTEREITVMTPYREQAKRYRELFRKLRWFHVEVLTVDSMQGQENKCTIFDLVLARSRLGGPGFVVDKHRLNVALSRSQDMFIMVADTEALSDQKDATYERNNPLPGYHEDSNTKDVCKQLRKVFAYFISKGMVHLTNPSRFPELQQLDLTKLDEFEARKQALAVAHICRNCGAEGHKARECDQASVHLPRCYKCRQLGHRQGECRRVRCHNCGQLGHSVAGCKQVKCFRCLELGHDKAHCTNAPRQKLRFSMPGGEDIMKLARELGSG